MLPESQGTMHGDLYYTSELSSRLGFYIKQIQILSGLGNTNFQNQLHLT